MIDKEICDKGFIWNPSNCECECDKSSDVGEYLDYKNCKCWKRLVHKLIEKCRENIDEKKLHSTEFHSNKKICNSTVNDYEKICSSCEHSSCTIYIVLFVIFFIITICISSVFIYFHCYLKRKYIETKIYWMQFCWTYIRHILTKLILKTVHITF